MRPAALATLISLATVGLLSGCVYFANADSEIAALQKYAGALDGVSAVDEVSNGAANMANPFSDAAEGVVLITVEGDDWRETMPLVAGSVIDWLDTKQTNSSVDLRAGVAFPGGVIGLADTEATTARIELATVLAADTRVLSAEIGWHENPGGYADNASAPVVVERDPRASVSAVATHWLPALINFGPLTVGVATPDEVYDADSTTRGQRTVEFDGPHDDLPAYLAWIDAVDGMTEVQGWRTSSTSTTVAIRTASSLADTETALRGLPGFDQVGALTLIYGEITFPSDGTVTVERSVAELLAGDARFTDIAPVDGGLTVSVPDLRAARDLVALAETVPGSSDVPLTLRFDESNDRPQFDEVAVGQARGWLDLVESVPDDIGVDSLRVFGDSNRLVVSLTGTYDSARVLALFGAIRDQSVSTGASVNLGFDTDDEFFIAQFDAAPRITNSGVWAGNDTDRTGDHNDMVRLWNSLD